MIEYGETIKEFIDEKNQEIKDCKRFDMKGNDENEDE